MLLYSIIVSFHDMSDCKMTTPVTASLFCDSGMLDLHVRHHGGCCMQVEGSGARLPPEGRGRNVGSDDIPENMCFS